MSESPAVVYAVGGAIESQVCHRSSFSLSYLTSSGEPEGFLDDGYGYDELVIVVEVVFFGTAPARWCWLFLQAWEWNLFFYLFFLQKTNTVVDFVRFIFLFVVVCWRRRVRKIIVMFDHFFSVSPSAINVFQISINFFGTKLGNMVHLWLNQSFVKSESICLLHITVCVWYEFLIYYKRYEK